MSIRKDETENAFSQVQGLTQVSRNSTRCESFKDFKYKPSESSTVFFSGEEERSSVASDSPKEVKITQGSFDFTPGKFEEGNEFAEARKYDNTVVVNFTEPVASKALDVDPPVSEIVNHPKEEQTSLFLTESLKIKNNSFKEEEGDDKPIGTDFEEDKIEAGVSPYEGEQSKDDDEDLKDLATTEERSADSKQGSPRELQRAQSDIGNFFAKMFSFNRNRPSAHQQVAVSLKDSKSMKNFGRLQKVQKEVSPEVEDIHKEEEIQHEAETSPAETNIVLGSRDSDDIPEIPVTKEDEPEHDHDHDHTDKEQEEIKLETVYKDEDDKDDKAREIEVDAIVLTDEKEDMDKYEKIAQDVEAEKLEENLISVTGNNADMITEEKEDDVVISQSVDQESFESVETEMEEIVDPEKTEIRNLDVNEDIKADIEKEEEVVLDDYGLTDVVFTSLSENLQTMLNDKTITLSNISNGQIGDFKNSMDYFVYIQSCLYHNEVALSIADFLTTELGESHPFTVGFVKNTETLFLPEKQKEESLPQDQDKFITTDNSTEEILEEEIEKVRVQEEFKVEEKEKEKEKEEKMEVKVEVELEALNEQENNPPPELEKYNDLPVSQGGIISTEINEDKKVLTPVLDETYEPPVKRKQCLCFPCARRP